MLSYTGLWEVIAIKSCHGKRHKVGQVGLGIALWTSPNTGYNSDVDDLIANILDALRQGELSPAELDRLIRAESKRQGDGRRRVAKKHVLPYFLEACEEQGDRWESWCLTPELRDRFVRTLQMKPRRTASGVATITVITKPWPCCGGCLFCPNDVRMPKSYLHNEPACQRAERNFFDPYLQVASRLKALEAMGHPTDKIELIVLGGTFTDYPQSYRLWFIEELFACLNDSAQVREKKSRLRREAYENAGIESDADTLEEQVAAVQRALDEGRLTYNEAFEELYGPGTPWERAVAFQNTAASELEQQQRKNEDAAHRVVGLVVETRPDKLDGAALNHLRHLGCTKVQMGIQSLDEATLAANGRPMTIETLSRALGLCRLFGFKTHIHFMVNLVGATPTADKEGYRQLMEDARFKPDEVKLYPCALVGGTPLVALYDQGRWRPYSEEELLDVLCFALEATPRYARVSRMIRDISSEDILAGNKKTNLRQMVEARLHDSEASVEEIRFREMGTTMVAVDELTLNDCRYATTLTTEHFLEWTAPDGRIAGFLRLSLPQMSARTLMESEDVPIGPDEAMIREVHIYGFAAEVGKEGVAAQHHGLGRRLVEHACRIAHDAGFKRINVISAVGTRNYYRALGFRDNGLYQQRTLTEEELISNGLMEEIGSSNASEPEAAS